VLPDGLDWSALSGLSNEVRHRVTHARPGTLGQLARLPGVTPAAVNLVAGWVTRGRGAVE